MKYIILDLEWNTAYSSSIARFVNEIIEFGAVKLDEKLRIIDSFSSFVKPQIDKKLRTRVKTLTNISNEDVASADTFDVVSDRFKEWVGDKDEYVLMSWGDMDVRVLIDNCAYFFDNDPHIPFISKYVDLQGYFMDKKNLPKAQQIGLSNAAILADIDPDAFTHHRALNDSELSAACFEKVYDEEAFSKEIIVCDEEFYKRILFKPYIITDIKDKLIDESLLSCKCQECGKPAGKITDWKFGNNAFFAFFYCKQCKIKYRVNVQYRKTYSQLNMKKNVTIINK